MARVQVAQSRGSKIEVILPDQADAAPRILAVAHGDATMLPKVNSPIAEMRLRGFGQSLVDADSAKDSSLRHYMSDFDVALQQADMERAILFGYSHGGYFLTMYALRNRANVSALILVEPALFTERAELERRAQLAENGDAAGSIQAMLSYVDRQVGLDEDQSIEVTKSVLSDVQSSETLAREFRIRAENPISERDLNEIEIPVLLIGGTESRIADMVTRAAHSIPYASVFWIRGASHLDLQPGANPKFAAQISGAINTFMAALG